MSKSFDFFSEAEAHQQFDQPWTVKSGPMQALCSIPNEFNGAGGGFSPEDFYLQALINCFVGTFKVYAKASKVVFQDVSVKGSLNVGPNAEGKVVMKKVTLNIQVNGCERPDRIQTLVAKVIRDGYVLNSVKSEIEYSLEVDAQILFPAL
jgi:organic hydroperoxide reductase OsmC/OhrA